MGAVELKLRSPRRCWPGRAGFSEIGHFEVNSASVEKLELGLGCRHLKTVLPQGRGVLLA